MAEIFLRDLRVLVVREVGKSCSLHLHQQCVIAAHPIFHDHVVRLNWERWHNDAPFVLSSAAVGRGRLQRPSRKASKNSVVAFAGSGMDGWVGLQQLANVLQSCKGRLLHRANVYMVGRASLVRRRLMVLRVLYVPASSRASLQPTLQQAALVCRRVCVTSFIGKYLPPLRHLRVTPRVFQWGWGWLEIAHITPVLMREYMRNAFPPVTQINGFLS